MGSNQSSNYPIRSGEQPLKWCLLLVVWQSSLLICVSPFACTPRPGEERERDEQERRPKGTGNKWSGRKNKTRGREKEGQIRWRRTRPAKKMGWEKCQKAKELNSALNPQDCSQMGEQEFSLTLSTMSRTNIIILSSWLINISIFDYLNIIVFRYVQGCTFIKG